MRKPDSLPLLALYALSYCTIFSLYGCYTTQSQIIPPRPENPDWAQEEKIRPLKNVRLSIKKGEPITPPSPTLEPEQKEAPVFRRKSAFRGKYAYYHPTSGIKFPHQFGKFQYVGKNSLEARAPGYGVIIHYRNSFSKLSFYVYNLGLSEIPDGIENDLVKAAYHKALKEISAMIQRGLYGSPKVQISSEIQIPRRAQQSLPAYMTTLALARKSQAVITTLVLTGYNNHFVKMRLTYPYQKNSLYHKDLRDSLAQMGKLLPEKIVVY